jgi:hypothetical protein
MQSNNTINVKNYSDEEKAKLMAKMIGLSMINKKIEDSQPKQPQPKQPLTKAQKGKVVALILAAAKIANKSKPKPKGKE